MNKQKNRYTPFTGKYRMPVNEFCEKYGLSLPVVMRRMNILYWEDYNALVVPTDLESTTADKIRRSLQLINIGWDNASIGNRMNITEAMVEKIRNLDDYKKQMFLSMDHYFNLNPEKIDLDKIFGKEASSAQ